MPSEEELQVAVYIKKFLAERGTPATREDCWYASELLREIDQARALYHLLCENKITVEKIPASGDPDDVRIKAVGS